MYQNVCQKEEKSTYRVQSFSGKMYCKNVKSIIYSQRWIQNQCAWYVINKFQCSKTKNHNNNIWRHDETHKDKYHHLHRQLRKEKIKKLFAGLKKQKGAFTCSRDVSDGAVKVSYLIANELVQASKPFSDGELVKKCMLKAAEVVWPEKQFAFANISLSKNTFADRLEDLSQDLGSQINDKIK